MEQGFPEPVPAWAAELIDLGDLELNVRTGPPGPDERAVYVHGLAGSATNWTDLMALLAEDVAGHAVDLPGAGYSPAPADGDYSIDAHARAVTRLIEHLGAPVHLFGNSLGGAVSVRLAASRPDLVRSLTLVSPALPDLLPRVGPARVAMSVTPVLAEWAVKRLTAVPAERRIQATLEMCYADLARVHPVRLREAIEELRRRDGLPYAAGALISSARGIVREYFKNDLWREAAKITVPTLVVHGGRDRLVDARMAMRAGRTFPNVRIVTLPKAGHVAQMEFPEVVAREARRLIAESRAAVR
ncbi:alpha/beta hydrolase [Acrocarpospora macrocephala]|uniref:Alpha/beta hydrolase n=1 Tax=Acrocarpospora macrocephala TaxID=150177 RepID=A0A5M3X8R7_9ACTN|nr:alpha/beta hydrolase [Acrocarpospora macrocephala]GES14528.1 alpha/beta hydrolase [Acrocarpospora macrocephala]